MSELALLKCAKRGDLKKAKKLVSKQKVRLAARDDEGRTALHIAAEFGKDEILSFLIGQPGVDVNVEDKHGVTPLLRAILNQQEKSVFVLIEAGANPEIKSKHGVYVWDKADLLFPKSVVRRLKSEAAMARAKHRPTVYHYQEPTDDTVKWGDKTVTVSSSSSLDSPQQQPQNMGYSEPQQSQNMGYSDPQQPQHMGYSDPQQSQNMGYDNQQDMTPPTLGTTVSYITGSRAEGLTSKEMSIISLIPTNNSVNLDQVIEAISLLVSGAAAPYFTVQQLQVVNLSLEPLSNAIRKMIENLGPFASFFPQGRQAQMKIASQKVIDSLVGFPACVRSLNEDPADPGPHHKLLDVSKKLVSATSALYNSICAGVTNKEIAMTIQESAISTKVLLTTALSRSSDVALQQAYRNAGAQHIHLIRVLNTRMVAAKEVDDQHKIGLSIFTISRAIEACIITSKMAFTGNDDARGNLATLAKALAAQYQKVTEFTTKKTSIVAIPTQFDERTHYIDAFKQISAAHNRFNHRVTNIQSVKKQDELILDVLKQMSEQVPQLRDAVIDPMDPGLVMSTSFEIGKIMRAFANIAIQSAQYSMDPSFRSCLSLTAQNALYFSEQLSLATAIRSLRVSMPQNFSSLAYSLRGVCSVLAIASEAQIY